jgi:hypothetical protein
MGLYHTWSGKSAQFLPPSAAVAAGQQHFQQHHHHYISQNHSGVGQSASKRQVGDYLNTNTTQLKIKRIRYVLFHLSHKILAGRF